MIEAIEHLVAELTAAFNEHDPAAFAACFTEDADFTDVIGNTVFGQAEIERLHRFPFTHVMREATMTIDRTDVRFLRPDLAVVLARWTVTGNRSPTDEPLPPRSGILHVVCTLLSLGPERWKIASALNSEQAGVYARHFKPGETLGEAEPPGR